MRDIENREDIQYLVEAFYEKALKDEIIGPVFKAAHFSLEAHIPVMVTFWETILLDVVTYKGNPMLKHIALDKTVPLEPEHFARWMSIWTTTVAQKFDGLNAQQAINRADSIAKLMQFKIESNRK
ncbi:group III truncated hemoglobin [Pedobacter frigoris]|uniref:Group III truncated hemoglobin n=1 Tax=Pedobacter frigoris TaxID=2571272 RepID=A0A4V5P0P5_9SPHI|nr:group III truncated hemoglobin [Pedobacter frigoris]TKC05943.1 group III truncated hemoglobin [Pedobacter frigoris]